MVDLWVAISLIWVSVAVAACYGIYITKSIWCLLLFVFPWTIGIPRIKGKTDDKDNKNKKGGHTN